MGKGRYVGWSYFACILMTASRQKSWFCCKLVSWAELEMLVNVICAKKDLGGPESRQFRSFLGKTRSGDLPLDRSSSFSRESYRGLDPLFLEL